MVRPPPSRPFHTAVRPICVLCGSRATITACFSCPVCLRKMHSSERNPRRCSNLDLLVTSIVHKVCKFSRVIRWALRFGATLGGRDCCALLSCSVPFLKDYRTARQTVLCEISSRNLAGEVARCFVLLTCCARWACVLTRGWVLRQDNHKNGGMWYTGVVYIWL